jgi:hypothetical protein
LSYALDGGGNVYVRYAKGFKAGGVNPVVPPSLFPSDFGKVFGPEQVNTYEAGWKDELLDHRLQVTSAIFYNDYTGLQYTTSRQRCTSGADRSDHQRGNGRNLRRRGKRGLANRAASDPDRQRGLSRSQVQRSFSNSDGAVLNTFNFDGNRNGQCTEAGKWPSRLGSTSRSPGT